MGVQWREMESVDQFILEGVISQLRVVFQAHFFKNPGAVGADGGNAQGQLVWNDRNGAAWREQAHDLEFAGR